MPTAPDSVHEWVSIPDPDEERTWMFDVTFLLSNWTCIFGRGCQGVLTAPAPEMVQGCCSYGAHFTDAADVKRVEKAAAKLTPDVWQFHPRGQKGTTRTKKDGTVVSRIVDGACIFLNRPGFPAGPGCALHLAALQRDQRPMDLKPEVCWQVPLRREDHRTEDGHVISTIGQWDRRHWGDGGTEFSWWCTESPSAFVGTRPVYQEMADELGAMVGPKVHAAVRRFLAERAQGGTPLPHPTVRRRDKAANRERAGTR
jgi:hypothetical protein